MLRSACCRAVADVQCVLSLCFAAHLRSRAALALRVDTTPLLAQASGALTTLLTFAAAKIILAQVEGSGRGGLAAFNRGTYDSLAQMLEPDALKLLQRDPDAWCLELMNLDQLAGVRVLETRAAYAQDGFEWEQLQSLTNEGIKKANESIMRTHASAAFQAGLDSL